MALAGLDVTVRRATPDVFSGFAVLRPDLGVLTLRRIEGVEESWRSSCGIECAIIVCGYRGLRPTKFPAVELNIEYGHSYLQQIMSTSG